MTDLLALQELKSQISGDPNGVLNSWNHSKHHCQWQGVTCDTRHQRVTALTLSGMGLSGTISPHIGNLSFMKSIHLGENQFHGGIPQEVGLLFRLRFLNMSSNNLKGEILVNLSWCSELRVVDLISNQLEGKVPNELGSLKKLVALYLNENNLTGEIPRSLGNASSMTELALAYNHLNGNLPKELGLLKSLSWIIVGVNGLVGDIPSSVFNISTLTSFVAVENMLHGMLPANIGLTLPNLEELELGGNQFHGNIPTSITNASKLQFLDLSQNKFEGQVPTNLGDLPNLLGLNLAMNLLGSNSAGDLSFLPSLTNCSRLHTLDFPLNHFGGELPKNIGNLSLQLTYLHMGYNNISGTIPKGFGNLVNLNILSMTQNSFTGGIPGDFPKLQKLQALDLEENKLSGQILSTLCNITSLYYVGLSKNSLEGNITRFLENCKNLGQLSLSWNNFNGSISAHIFGSYLSLISLDLSHNSLIGSLPSEVGKLKGLNELDISYNKLHGEIPGTLGDCSSLEELYMQGNFFQGTIPMHLASLKGIQKLDLSNNNLTGPIPQGLEKLMFLKYLNISFNDLNGEVPTEGVFRNASQISLAGNRKLCGGIPQLRLPPCITKRKKKSRHLLIIVISVFSPVALISMILLAYIIAYNKKARRHGSSSKPSMVDKLFRVSYHELHRATSGFSPANLIGSGSFGLVYRGRLYEHGDRLIAVKVLDLQKNGASKSFKAECKALRNIRHRNLLPILSYCSSIDSKGLDFKALVYEFMGNGNLDLWLHPETAEMMGSRNLNLHERLNIAIDVASALNYLHYQCEVPIVHCDLKPSNILLDNNLVAHVGDFGQAKLLASTTDSSSLQGSSSAIAVKGSMGYVAPEYGMGLQVSTQGDVYSYGILLLEMFTGKRPTDDIFMDGLDLHNYVKTALPEQVLEVVDPILLLSKQGDEIEEESAQVGLDNDDKKMECITSILKIGVECSATSPNDRMHMGETVRKLHRIRDGFLDANYINKANLDI
ncbi:LRR receptor-like serine/threonine-protein kinase EFR [Coffea arabica]|uniref:LRR receptor-like serine/threonine-protein kinase EFR n=1 Tax=Coffea arabica TaxID=13443 RepID=A0ABM4VF65_COFAR